MNLFKKFQHKKNIGSYLPGEWLSDDLGLKQTDEALAHLQKEYKRKMDEDTMRVKKTRQDKKVKKASQEKADGTPSFDYGQILVNDAIKIDFFKEIVSGFRTPQHGSNSTGREQMSLPDADKLKGYMHVCSDMEFPEPSRAKAREKIMEMLQL